jgi:hypothetical protein
MRWTEIELTTLLLFHTQPTSILVLVMVKELSRYDQIDRICTVIPGTMSCFGTLVITLSVLLFSKLRTETFFLVTLQSISEMIFNLSIIAFYNPPSHGHWQCQFQGWVINYGIMSSIFFSGAIAGHMFYMIRKVYHHLDRSFLVPSSQTSFHHLLPASNHTPLHREHTN